MKDAPIPDAKYYVGDAVPFIVNPFSTETHFDTGYIRGWEAIYEINDQLYEIRYLLEHDGDYYHRYENNLMKCFEKVFGDTLAQLGDL